MSREPALFGLEVGKMTELDVDDIDFVRRSTESVPSFLALVAARHEAGYRHGRRMSEFVVGHGRWYLDTCGNTGAIELQERDGTIASPQECVPGLEAVMTAQQFKVALDPSVRLCYDAVTPLPTAETICEICGQTWNMDDLHTATMIRDADDKRLFFHKICRASQLAERAETELRTLCGVAQMGIAELTQVPNRYGSLSYHGPWFLIRLDDGVLVIFGWRKRAMHIEWSKSRDLTEVFSDVQNTKGPNFVHAWNYAQAADYLRRLRDNLVAPARVGPAHVLPRIMFGPGQGGFFILKISAGV